MRIDIDGQPWDRGFWDGEAGKPLNSSPYAPGTSASLSWSSGYVEGKAFRNGFIATPPSSCVPLRKKARGLFIWGSCVDDARVARGIWHSALGRVQVMCPACCCGHVTAGPDVIRGSGPDQNFGLEALRLRRVFPID